MTMGQCRIGRLARGADSQIRCRTTEALEPPGHQGGEVRVHPLAHQGDEEASNPTDTKTRTTTINALTVVSGAGNTSTTYTPFLDMLYMQPNA